MRALIVGDIHLADKPPSVRRDSYTEDILDKLRFTSEVANGGNTDLVIWVGDVFHLKTPSRVSHSLVQECIKIGQSYNRPWLIVPGNHDMAHDRLDSLVSQPLGTLFKAGAERFVGPSKTCPQVAGIPYLNDWTKLPTLLAALPSSVELLVAHAPIMPPGKTAPFEFISADDWAKAMPERAMSIYYGHIHDQHGEYTVDPGGDLWEFGFCNNGALSRGSIHESDLKREPAITIWDSAVHPGWEKIPVPHKPVSEVFRLPDKAEEHPELAEAFLENINSTQLTMFSVESVMKVIRDSDTSEKVARKVEELLEQQA